MSAVELPSLTALAQHLRVELENKKYILLYAYNGTGKTRLSTEFKNLGKNGDERDTLYFNAFTEDLFSWDNDLENDRERVLKINAASRFFAGLGEMEMDNRIRPLLNRYADFDFRIDTTNWEISFSHEIQDGDTPTETDHSHETRGRENIFMWCFFVAIVELAIDGTEAYRWVKYIYIDDPISSLDEHNAIAVAHHLAQMLKRANSDAKAVISTHHTLFFNVLHNEFRDDLRKKTAKPYFLSKDSHSGEYLLRYTGDTPFFHHVATLIQLHQAAQTGELYTYHFNMLRAVLEKTASYHGYPGFSACIKRDDDDPDGDFHARLIAILNHGNYSLYEPQEMIEENKRHFRQILEDFLERYPFNRTLFPSAPSPSEGAADNTAQKIETEES